MDFVRNVLRNNKDTLRGILAVCMIVAGVLHFVANEPFTKIVPAFLPFPAMIVYVSGVIEILLGVGLIVPQSRVLSAWGLVALFIAVYPANLNMAFNHIKLEGIPDSWWLHGFRLPFQAVLIAWAYWYTNAGRSRAGRSRSAATDPSEPGQARNPSYKN